MIDLNLYSEQQIVEMIMGLDVTKFLAVLQAIAAETERMRTRGEAISRNRRDDDINRLMGGA